jgi:aerobic-type carbon monoxide dehydrogenase small subunit (CoxS/CutS family)/CO/xanthine dehydrogenase FAD-binding subunit
MLAHGIRSYHRPTRLEEALSMAAQGMTPLAGGTRLFATDRELPNVLDLWGLGLDGLSMDDSDLVLGATTSLQDVLDSPTAWTATAGLLPEACRAHSVSRMLRGMATVGGEAAYAAHDSEVAAALLALNAVFVVKRPAEVLEIPALRFLRDPREDLAGGGLLTSIFIPGAPGGAALERVAVLPSAPSLVTVAVALSLSGGKCSRARIAVSGLFGPPARVTEAEDRIELTGAGDDDVEECARLVARAAFRDDAHAPADYRGRAARVLALRALRRAVAMARGARPLEPPRSWRALRERVPAALPYFTSGRMDLTVNGAALHPDVEARTTLLDLLRRLGYWGVKHGCETGECGACAVLLDGRPVSTCLTLALRAAGRQVQTVEGLGAPDRLHPIQTAFVDTGAIQCGYCTPAMELCAKALLDNVADPSEAEVRDALAGCLCRCTGYVKPVQAVLAAAREMAAAAQQSAISDQLSDTATDAEVIE